MADTTTTVLGLVKQTIGANRNTWGSIINSAMDSIEGAFYGMTSKVVIGGSYTLTADERRKRILNFTGTLAADQTIIIPNLVGRWTVRNGTSGDFSLSFKTTSGTAVAIPQSGHCEVWCDGADVVYTGMSTRQRDTQFTAPSGTLDAPGISWGSEIASGWYRVSAGVFALVINGVAVFTYAGTALRAALTDAGLAITGALSVSGAISCGSLTVGGVTPTPIGSGMDYDGIYEPNGWKFRNGQALDRTTYALLFAALTVTAGATRNATTTLSSVDVDLTGLGLEGSPIEGTGIASGTTVSSITSTSIVLSQAATGSGSMTIRLLPHGVGDGSTTFNVPDDMGRVNPGRDNMGGTSANRLTGLTDGIDGDKLGTTGGEEAHQLVDAEMPDTAISGSGTVTPTVNGGSPATGWPSGGGYQLIGGGDTGAFNLIRTSDMKSFDEKTVDITGTISGGNGAHNNVQPSRITNKIIFTGVYA